MPRIEELNKESCFYFWYKAEVQKNDLDFDCLMCNVSDEYNVQNEQKLKFNKLFLFA